MDKSSKIVISFIKSFLNRLIYLVIGSVLFSKSSFFFLKYKCAIRLIYFFINYFSFRTSSQLTGHLKRSCCFDWVGFFRNIWTIPHSPLIVCFSMFFTLYPVLAFCNFSFRVNKFSWNCLMNEKVLLITGATFSQSKSFARKKKYCLLMALFCRELFYPWKSITFILMVPPCHEIFKKYLYYLNFYPLVI